MEVDVSMRIVLVVGNVSVTVLSFCMSTAFVASVFVCCLMTWSCCYSLLHFISMGIF